MDEDTVKAGLKRKINIEDMKREVKKKRDRLQASSDNEKDSQMTVSEKNSVHPGKRLKHQ